MKRQGTFRSSSSGREAAAGFSSGDQKSTTTVHHAANSVGCMAGVFQLISSKYRTRRKFLTFGKKQHQKQSTLSASSSPSPARKTRSECNSREIRRLSCEVPRSPTIPPEIRRSNSLNSPESFRSPVPSVVARLMGLEDTPEAPPPTKPDSASEKRRKLLGALEKCDEDLQALKRIIEAVRFTDRSKSPPLVSVGRGGVVETKKSSDTMNGIVEQEQPSPVSVLEDFCESPPSTGGWHSPKRTKNDMARLEKQQRKKPREDNIEIASFRFNSNNNNVNNRLQLPRSPFFPMSDRKSTPSPLRSSGESMSDSVDEVCKDVEMGQKREIERVGVVIEDFIYRDLIEELTKCLLGPSHVGSPRFPYEKCKRKLRF